MKTSKEGTIQGSDKPLLRRKEVAELLQLSERTVRRYRAAELPVVYPKPRTPRYRFEDVQKLIAKRTIAR